MSALSHPHSVKQIKSGIENVKHKSYNVLQMLKQKTLAEEKDKITGKEGPETDAAIDKGSIISGKNKLAGTGSFSSNTDEYAVTAAEMDKYRKI